MAYQPQAGRVDQPRIIGLYSTAPQSGKSTLAQALTATGDWKLVKFAGILKGMLGYVLIEAGFPAADVHSLIEGAHKETRLEVLGNKSPRYALQTLGTEWGRDLIDTNLWASLAIAKAKRLAAQGYNVVMDDVRFPNEAHAIWTSGGDLWRIQRQEATQTTVHQSEGLLDGFDFQKTLSNDGSLDSFIALAGSL